MDRVLDVSNVNYPSDDEWLTVARDPTTKAVIAKATEGLNFKDGKYQAARLKTRMMGRVFGSYLFLHARDGGAKQAQAYLEYAAPKEGDLHPIVDAEQGGLDRLSVAEMAAVTMGAMNELAKHGYDPILYSDASFLRSLYAAQPGLKRWRVWDAQYASHLDKLPGVRTVLWQFTDRMTVGRGRFDGSYLLSRSIDDLRIGTLYYTYQKDVPLKPGQALRFKPGKGYYAGKPQ